MIIYKITNLVNGKIYIGQDSNNNPNYFGSGKIIKSAINKYGIKNFTKETIDFANSRDELNEKEIYWIKELNARDSIIGYNITEGGGGMSGHKHSKETREKQRISKLGDKNPNFGKIPSEETRLKSSNSHKGEKNSMFGKHHSEKTKSKIRETQIGDKNYNFGKHRTEEIKSKISKKQKGVPKSKETCEKMKKSWDYDKHFTENVRKKISIANSGQNNSNSKTNRALREKNKENK